MLCAASLVFYFRFCCFFYFIVYLNLFGFQLRFIFDGHLSCCFFSSCLAIALKSIKRRKKHSVIWPLMVRETRYIETNATTAIFSPLLLLVLFSSNLHALRYRVGHGSSLWWTNAHRFAMWAIKMMTTNNRSQKSIKWVESPIHMLLFF